MKKEGSFYALIEIPFPVATITTLEFCHQQNPALTKQLDANGWSPLLHTAYVACHPTIVRQLLQNSDRYVIYLGVKDHGIGKRTTLHVATCRGHVEIVKLLVSHLLMSRAPGVPRSCQMDGCATSAKISS